MPGLGGQPSFDQTKPWGLGQQAPLTPEYQKVLADSIADQANGGEGNFFDHAVRCLPGGMPINMIAFRPLEVIVTPETTYIRSLASGIPPHLHRRTGLAEESRAPMRATRSANGSIPMATGLRHARGRDRGPFKGPRTYDATGLPLAFDGKSRFEERIFRDKADPKIMHDIITVHDNALTRPWTVDKKYVLEANPRPDWSEAYCGEIRR